MEQKSRVLSSCREGGSEGRPKEIKEGTIGVRMVEMLKECVCVNAS